MNRTLTKDYQKLPKQFQGKPILADQPSGPFTVKNTKFFIVPTDKGYELQTAKSLNIPKAISGTKLSDQQQLELVTKRQKGVNLFVNKDGQLKSITVKIGKTNKAEIVRSTPISEQEIKILSSSIAVKLTSSKSLQEFQQRAISYGASYDHLRKNNLFTQAQKSKISDYFNTLKKQSEIEKTQLRTAVGEEKNKVNLSSKTLSDERFINSQKTERNQKIEANIKSESFEPKEKKEKKRERNLNIKRVANLGR